MTVGEKLKNLRGATSVENIVKHLNIGTSAWYMYERDQRVPKDATKKKICEFFKVSIEEIFFAD